MFDLSIWEIAVVAIVAILVIGPSELPRALVTAGKWIRKFRSFTNGFRNGLDAMIRETEMNELEKKWAQQNQKIMADHPNEMLPLPPTDHAEQRALDEPIADNNGNADKSSADSKAAEHIKDAS